MNLQQAADYCMNYFDKYSISADYKFRDVETLLVFTDGEVMDIHSTPVNKHHLDRWLYIMAKKELLFKKLGERSRNVSMTGNLEDLL